MRARIWLILSIFALLVLAACIATPRPRPVIVWPSATPAPSVRTLSVSHPRLILSTTNLDAAITHKATGLTKTVYDGIGTTYPVSMTLAVAQAFKCNVEVADGGACGTYGTNAVTFVLAYVADPVNDPATIWAPISTMATQQYRYVLPWERTVGVALIYDWMYNYMDAGQQATVRAYLNQWSAFFTTALATDPTPPLGIAYATILMATSGESGIPANAATDLNTIAYRWSTLYWTGTQAKLLAGGQATEGPWYVNVNAAFPQAVFLAAVFAETELAAVPPRFLDFLDWLQWGNFSKTLWLQYGDATAEQGNAKLSMWLQYAWLLSQTDDLGHYWLFQYLRTTDPTSSWWDSGISGDVVGKPMFVIYYDPTITGSITTAAYSHIFRDTDTQDQGGIVVMRDGWGDSANVLSFANRYFYAPHNHYDYNSVTLAQDGIPMLVDYDLYPYFTTEHGKDYGHSTVLVNGGGLSANSSQWTNNDDSTAWGMIPAYVDAAGSALAVGEANHALGDVTAVGGGTAKNKNSITPATTARRIVVQSDFLTPTVWVVFDNYAKTGAISLTLQYVLDTDATVTGWSTGTTTVTHGGQSLTIIPSGYTFDALATYTAAELRDADLSVKALQDRVSSAAATWLTILAPSTDLAPSVTITTSGTVSVTRLTYAGSGDYLDTIHNPTRTTITVTGLTTDAEALVLGYGSAATLTWGALVNYATAVYSTTILPGSSGIFTFAVGLASGAASTPVPSATPGPYLSPTPTPPVTATGAPSSTPTVTRTPTATHTAFPQATVYAPGEANPPEGWDACASAGPHAIVTTTADKVTGAGSWEWQAAAGAGWSRCTWAVPTAYWAHNATPDKSLMVGFDVKMVETPTVAQIELLSEWTAGSAGNMVLRYSGGITLPWSLSTEDGGGTYEWAMTDGAWHRVDIYADQQVEGYALTRTPEAGELPFRLQVDGTPIATPTGAPPAWAAATQLPWDNYKLYYINDGPFAFRLDNFALSIGRCPGGSCITPTPAPLPAAALWPELACPQLTVSVDGATTEWAAVTPYTLTTTSAAYVWPVTTPVTLTGVFRCAHDGALLYLSGVITDTTVVSPTGSLENGDAARVVLDGLADGDFRHRLDDHDLLVGSDGAVRDFEVYPIGATAVTSPTVGGWQWELSIPLATLEASTAVGEIVGLTFGLHDSTGGSTWAHVLTGAKRAGRLE